MSPRAACRLETLGFAAVYDYVAGKADWLARGLPREGSAAGRRVAGDLARDDVPRCGLGDPLCAVAERIESSGYGFALVVAENGTLLGRLPRSALEQPSARRVEDVMRPGPSTVRFDTPAAELAERLRTGGLRTAVVTTPDGGLVGVVHRADLER